MASSSQERIKVLLQHIDPQTTTERFEQIERIPIQFEVLFSSSFSFCKI